MSKPGEGEDLLEHILKIGHVTVIRADGSRRMFGDGSEDEIIVRFTDERAQADLARNPVMAMGELYSDGRYVVEKGTIFDLLSLMKRNGSAKRLPPQLVAKSAFGFLTGQARDRVTGEKAKANIAHHYDLDDGLFDFFLDRNKQYSCAYFEDGDEDLDTAQIKKMRHIAAKLQIEPGQTVLDVGCGWGGLARYLAKVCGAKVTGITLSERQAAEARKVIAEEGLSDRISIELTDYRAMTGSFDRIVSVGMLEHVGLHHYRDYFDMIAARLTRVGGIALVHSIGDTKPGRKNQAWMEKYIFPGGYIPALSEVTPHAEKGGLLIKDIEILPIHYARTLRHWRERFMARAKVAETLYDKRFVRMWEFYLAASETAFLHDRLFVFQMQLARHQDAVPYTRGYIGETEKALARREQEVGI